VLISVSADELTGIAVSLLDALKARGHTTLAYGVLAEGERDDWAWAAEAVARTWQRAVPSRSPRLLPECCSAALVYGV